MARCRLFKAVQDTLPESEKIKRIESPKDAAKAVKFMLEEESKKKNTNNNEYSK